MLERIFNIKAVRLLIAISDNDGSYVTLIAKKLDLTYSHAVKTIYKFEELGFVTTAKKGRIKRVYITEDGKEIAERFKTVIKKLEKLIKNAKS